MRGVISADYRQLERVSSLTGSPDGACAYTVYFWQDGAYHRRVELLLPGAEPAVISAGDANEREPAFSEDGRQLYFLSDGHVCVFDRGAGTVQTAFAPEEDFEAYGFALMPQGLAVKLRREKREAAPEGCDWEMPLVTESLRYRSDADHGFTRRYERRLLLAGENGKTVLLDEGERDWQALTCAGAHGLIFGQGGWMLMNTDSRETVCLDEQLLAVNNPPAVSPDGQTMLAAARSRKTYETGLYVFRLTGKSGGEPVQGTYDLPLCPGVYCDSSPERMNQLTFVGNGRALAVATFQAVPGLISLEAQTQPLCAQRLAAEGTLIECAQAGDALWVICGSSTQAMEVCLLVDGKCIPQARHNAWLTECFLPVYQPIDVPALDGGDTLHGWYMLPEKPEKAPVLLWIHGGPEGFYTDGLYLEMKAAVARGFAVVLPNPRGSSGYGPAYQHTGHEFDQGACVDVLTILDAVLRRHPELDAERLGVLGGSYGGFMSAMLAGTTKRFKAAVVIKPVTNWLFIHFKSSQSGQNVFANHRDFQDFLVDMIQQSPIVHAGNVDIPTLIIHGGQDQQCPVENAHQFYVAVRDTHPDLPVRLVVMPDCCHGYSRDSVEDYRVIQQETLDWLLKYV